MPRNKTRETKIRKMIEMGLSTTQIAGALHIKKAVIDELREGGKNVQSKENVKSKKEAGEPGGNRDPGNSEPQDRGGKPADPDPEFHPPGETGGEPQGSTGDPGSAGIKFIGGKKNMAKGKGKESDPDPEDFEYECPRCHHEFNERSDTCPSCGGSLSGYDE